MVKVYGNAERRSVDNLSLDVSEGEVFAFLGPNGAGKSTTAKVLTTLLMPTEGSVRVAGYDVVTESRKVRENIGYVAQSTGIDYFMTGRENLMLIGHLYHLKGKRLTDQVEKMLNYFGLAQVADQTCASYSGGMQRKLDIATALLHQPKVLFLDEPTLGLDAQSRIDLWEYVKRLNTDLGVTVFLTTHYLDEADKLADRVGIIDEGVLQACDTPSGLKDMLKGDSIALHFDGDDAEKARPLLEKAAFSKEVLDEQDGLRIYVDNGGKTIADVVHLLSDNGLRASSLTLARPTLDDVFIKFTGKSLDKMEEKVKPWWAQWAGDNWEQQEAEGSWKGNKWMNADGTPKDAEEFKAWSEAQQDEDAGEAGDAEADGESKKDDAKAEDNVSEEKDEKKEETPGGDPNWAGNEWVNKDGTPKDPEAMAKWLKDSAGKSAD